MTAELDSANRKVVTRRVIHAPRELVFRAFSEPEHLARWWGPSGFHNTFHEFDFKPGGHWRFIMHGPDGTNYHNHSVFDEVEEPERIVFRHLDPIHEFQMTITLAEHSEGTELTWHMLFPTVAKCDEVRTFVTEANEQNFDKLEAELKKMNPVIVEQTYHAPITSVWKAITDPNQMRQWYFTMMESFEPKVGFETQFNVQCDDKNYLHIWKIREVVPEKKISYSWKYGGYAGDSLVTFELSPEGDSTKLRLTHEGIESFQQSNPELVDNSDFSRESCMGGWNFLVGQRLKEFLERRQSASL